MVRTMCVVVLAGFAGAGCGASALGTAGDGIERAIALEVRREAGVVLLTQVFDPDAVMDALAVGELNEDDAGCIRLPGPDAPTVVWPRGFTARLEADRVEILDDRGARVGRVGETFRMAGGEVPFLHSGLGFHGPDQALAAARCPGRFWIVAPGTVSSG